MSVEGPSRGANCSPSGGSAAAPAASVGVVHTTASQTVGPYVAIGFAHLERSDLAPPGATGERISVTGRIVDADGKPMTDGMVEIWQADASGHYAGAESVRAPGPGPGCAPSRGPSAEPPNATAFKGFGRIPTDADGRFRFTSIKPGRVPGPGGVLQAPHVSVLIFSRGLLKHLNTRMYFPDEPSNAHDPILQRVPVERRHTLIARRGTDGVIAWDVVLQGSNETVFFDL